MNACTIIARNYLAHARVLAASFREHHPDGRFDVLLLDDVDEELGGDGEPFHLVRPLDFFSGEELDRLALVYDVTELATAVKARFLTHLLDAGRSEVVFFDPDIRIFAPLDDVAALARRDGIVLTPHDVEPLPRDRRQPSEIQILQSGAYNLGFIAVSEKSRPFLEWWAERLRLHCLASPGEGLFVDQKWIDFVPGYFEHATLRDPGCNVAYWNLPNRKLTRDGDRYRIDEHPLRFFHFSGFDPTKPHVLSRHALPSPRVLLSEQPAVRALCDAYARELFDNGYESVAKIPYGLGVLANGLPIERRMRRVYRDALLAFEEGRGEEPPRFGRDAEAFVSWLNEPVIRSRFAKISRYLHALHAERPDLRAAFPDLQSEDGARFLAWVRERGARESRIPQPLRPSPDDAASSGAYRQRPSALPGVNVVGYFRGELGVGEAARQLVAAFEAAGVACQTLTLDPTWSRREHPYPDRGDEAPYDVNVLCVNADALASAVERLGRDFFEGRYTIGVWHWEIAPFPEAWHDVFDLVDEIWVASDHAKAALDVVSPKPVYVVPPPVSLPEVPTTTRAQLGLPDRFTFLFVYDFASVLERKNPLGLIEAFTRAFAPGEGPVLVLKSINGDRHVEGLERVKLAAAAHPDVLVLDRYLSREETMGLTASCDAYVSLHRAEGFGLTMAEAMALGKPVLATGYSGNLTYMRNDTAYLVRYRLRPVPEGAEPYPPGGEWAEPDVEHAAELMKHIVAHPDEARARGLRAKADLLEHHGVAARAVLVRRRLEAIRSARRPPAPESPVPAAEPAETSSGLEPSGSPKHERAHDRARAFPGDAWEATSRFRPALPWARAALFHLLRPYTASLQELHAAMLDDALELRERVDCYERERISLLRDELSETRRAFLEGLRDLDDRLRLLAGQTVPALRRGSDAGRERLLTLEERVARLEAHHGDMERQLASMAGDVTRFQDGAREHLASLTERLRSLEASVDRLGRDVYALPYTADAMLERLEYATGALSSADADDFYAGFEAVFRGPEAEVSERLRPYVEILRSHAPVVDLGCGRGELLDLLAAAGVPARGVDVHPGVVGRCREKGHAVERADAVDYLAAQPDASIASLFSAHFIEHLPFEALLALFRLARRKLVPGGLLVAETVNPHAVAAMKHFWIDPTHEKPIFPELALTLCRLHGFASARILFPRGQGRFETDRFEAGEYAVVATAPSG